MVAVARAWPRDPLDVRRLRAGDARRQRALARARPQPLDDAPLRRHADVARLPPADADSRRYRLGPRVLDLGFAALNSMGLRELSRAHLQRLSDETGFTVNMAILDETDVVYIERCRTSRSGQREIDLNLHVGSRLPAYCTAIGKALLAHVPKPRLDELLGRMELVAAGRTRSRARPRSAPSSRASAHPASRSTTRSSPTGCARSRRRPRPVGRGDRGDQPRRPPHDALDGGPRRALRPVRAADGSCDLGRARLPLAPLRRHVRPAAVEGPPPKTVGRERWSSSTGSRLPSAYRRRALDLRPATCHHTRRLRASDAPTSRQLRGRGHYERSAGAPAQSSHARARVGRRW